MVSYPPMLQQQMHLEQSYKQGTVATGIPACSEKTATLKVPSRVGLIFNFYMPDVLPPLKHVGSHLIVTIAINISQSEADNLPRFQSVPGSFEHVRVPQKLVHSKVEISGFTSQ